VRNADRRFFPRLGRGGARRRLLVAFLAAWIGLPLVLAGHASGGTIYSWKDGEGVVHFSNRQPPQGSQDVRDIRYKPSKAPGGTQAGRSRAVSPKLQPGAGPPAPARPAPAPSADAPAVAVPEQAPGPVRPPALGGAGTRVALDELRGLDPEAVKAIYARLQRECGGDPQCRKKVDDLMQGVRP
jgi:hypothetical protein